MPVFPLVPIRASPHVLLLRCCHIPQRPDDKETTIVGRLLSELAVSGCCLESLLYNYRHSWSVPPRSLCTIVLLLFNKCKKPPNKPFWSPWAYTNHHAPSPASPSSNPGVSIHRRRHKRNISTLTGSQTITGHPRSLWDRMISQKLVDNSICHGTAQCECRNTISVPCTFVTLAYC